MLTYSRPYLRDIETLYDEGKRIERMLDTARVNSIPYHYETGRYMISVDWLSIYCTHMLPLDEGKIDSACYRPKSQDTPEPYSEGKNALPEGSAERTIAAVKRKAIGSVEIERLDYGTRQFSLLANVYIGRECFGQLQAYPRSSIIPANGAIFKIANRWLYSNQWRAKFDFVCHALNLTPQKISRLDIAADFNRFACGLHPIEFIRQFMAGELKHKGRGAGHVDFVQSYTKNADANRVRDILNFNALTIGKKTSDANCYLYNKTLELRQERDKPYIRQAWQDAGLNVHDVWRLEVSISRKGMQFKEKKTGEFIQISPDKILGKNGDIEVRQLYVTFIRSLFFFFYPSGQKNVSREKPIALFTECTESERGVVSSKNTTTRSERIMIKNLYMLAKRYRGLNMADDFAGMELAFKMADNADLQGWMAKRIETWQSRHYAT